MTTTVVPLDDAVAISITAPSLSIPGSIDDRRHQKRFLDAIDFRIEDSARYLDHLRDLRTMGQR